MSKIADLVSAGEVDPSKPVLEQPGGPPQKIIQELLSRDDEVRAVLIDPILAIICAHELTTHICDLISLPRQRVLKRYARERCVIVLGWHHERTVYSHVNERPRNQFRSANPSTQPSTLDIVSSADP
ncbi:unnamed protein product [Strongylus vulgaris]|uniref:Uncharacterized protein n=1 Tax=Strongylus vulgaris TaxID=40348 RepID=A0A3P7KIU3_STRVU|nr:unnamed protein product [Strongylus vulgaris]